MNKNVFIEIPAVKIILVLQFCNSLLHFSSPHYSLDFYYSIFDNLRFLNIVTMMILLHRLVLSADY